MTGQICRSVLNPPVIRTSSLSAMRVIKEGLKRTRRLD